MVAKSAHPRRIELGRAIAAGAAVSGTNRDRGCDPGDAGVYNRDQPARRLSTRFTRG